MDQNIWIIAVSAIGSLSGLSALYNTLTDKKGKDITNLKTICSELRIDRDSMKLEITDLKRSLHISDLEKLSIERDNLRYKRAINCKIDCDTDDENCPIICKYNDLSK